jgi:primosomal protein N' (replication factor Y)
MFYLLSVIVERGVMSLNHPFSYAYMGPKAPKKGLRVIVTLGTQEVMGFIVQEPVEVKETLEEYNTTAPVKIKYAKELVDDEPIITEELLNLAEEVASYYICPLIEVLKAMLPPSLRPDTLSLTKPQRAFKEAYVIADGVKIDEEALDSNEKKLLGVLKSHPEGLMKSEITSKISLAKLLHKGIAVLIKQEKLRLPEIEESANGEHDLNIEQDQAYQSIVTGSKKVFLLQGVTGSGKTEIYIKLIRNALKEGKGALVLVPEISLTDNMISRFKSIFGEEVALLHSGLTDSQKYDEYVRIARGDAKVVVGARSAVFAPVKNLAVIILDEEHVESYKQDTMPFYDARSVALMRVRGTERKLVFGSATPSLECRARADKGIYQLLVLKNRYNDVSLPEVSIIDLSDYGNIDYDAPLISIPLREKIAETLGKHEQTILLLNRRGYSPVYICRDCQKVLKCPNCNLPLTYHKEDRAITCHHCDYVLKSDDLVCPHCGGKNHFTYVGFGTERIEEDIQKLFPTAKVVRFDADTARKKGKYHQIITDFAMRKYDIMIGTQMVAKGHDFPYVTLAAALMADQSLEFPSYKANEDTFDLLTQLVGRSGRKDKKGYAIIQTYSPDNDIIKLACRQDYEAFYKYEMDNRQSRQYPPYTYLATINISSKERKGAEEAAFKIKNYLIEKLIAQPGKRTNLYGPSIPYIEKLGNRYHRSIMLKYKDRKLVDDALKGLNVLQLNSYDVRLSIDIDPSSDI